MTLNFRYSIITKFLYALTCLAIVSSVGTIVLAEDKPQGDGNDKQESEMKPYVQKIDGTSVQFEMLPIPGGVYTMGSPDTEAGRGDDEGPQHDVQIEPFWMGK